MKLEYTPLSGFNEIAFSLYDKVTPFKSSETLT